MAGQTEYRIEHVAEAPHGYHVRTMAPGPDSAHLIRVAFPPGRRKKGSGQLVEILHPVGENPSSCKNPSSVFSMAVSMGYPYLRGEGRVAADGRTWLSRVTKHADGSGGAIFIGWDSVNRKWVVEKERATNRSMDSFDKKHLTRWINENYRSLADRREIRRKILGVLKEYPEVLDPGQSRSWPEILRMANPFDWREQRQKTGTIVDEIRHGDRVTILTPHGSKLTGKAVMRGPYGWVLNLGGAHGTPGIATAENIVSVRKANPSQRTKISTFFDPAVKKWVAAVYHEKAGNLFRTAPTKREAAERLREEVERLNREPFRRNPLYILWALPKGSNNRLDEKPLTSMPITVSQVEKVKTAAAKDGWHGFRVKKDDHSMPDFARGIRGNPDEGQLEEAEDLYKTFHGREPREILEIQESSEARGEYTALGDLVELMFIAPTGDHVLVKFSGDGVRVASSPNGEQLYFLGGNQDISASLKSFGADEAKDLIDLGELKQIVYEAAKWQTDFTSQEWKHDLGEESGVRPRGFFDQLKRRIFIAGGNYKVKRPGIVD